MRNLPEDGSSTVLHGDLLPQNLLLAIEDDSVGDPEIAVIDWECAQIGDAAYDLAIVTRGVRRPFGEKTGCHASSHFTMKRPNRKSPLPR